MPLTPPDVTKLVADALSSALMVGPAASKLAFAVGIGVCQWLGALTVVTNDVGTAGSGIGQFPCPIPPSLLLAALSSNLPSAGIAGPSSAQLASGLANGLAASFAKGIITTVHPIVGVGVGVASFPGPSAIPFMLSGFGSASLVGSSAAKLATAIGSSLDQAFAGFTIPIPIVGAPSMLASAGVGGGKIV